MNENENVAFAANTNKERFEIRETDYAIIDNEMRIAPIMVEMEKTEFGEESQYADIAGVCSLLNQLDYEANHKAVDLSVHDGILEVERKLIVLEKIIKDIDYIARTNFKDSDSYPKKREYQYLMEIQKHYERLFNEAYSAINQVRRDLK